MKLINGKKIAKQIETDLAEKVSQLKVKPKICVFLLSDNPASALYVKKKKAAAERIGVDFELTKITPRGCDFKTIAKLIQQKNQDPSVTGIMVQLPVGKILDEQQILESIDPKKDVDCLTAQNFGLLAAGTPRFLPATVKAVETILEKHEVEIKSKRAVVIGASNIVGKPLALELSRLGATVTLVRSTEKNLSEITQMADILISCVGRPGIVNGQMVKPGVVAIDVGTTKVNGKLLGDLDFDSVAQKASLITPVPGGVGPLTVISLLENLLNVG